MTSSLEYHLSVRHSIPASIALFSLFALPAILVSTSHAQINGTPASVTSPGFGGRAINGTAPSVTSLAPNGSNSHVNFPKPNPSHDRDGHYHHEEYTLPPVVYSIAVPYAVDLGATDTDNDNNPVPDTESPDHSAGDRDVDNLNADVRNANDRESNYTSRALADRRDSESPQEPTLLIFKDGRKLEVSNYAILGATLFDLTPGHARRVALADLDLAATQKQNDDRGVTFQIPLPQAN